MGRTSKCDVLIAGAGISGLLLASALSREHSVRIIERRTEIPLNKYWVTNTSSMERNAHLTECIDSMLPHMDIVAHDLTSCRVDGPFVLWSTDGLLNYLERVCLENGVCVEFGKTLYNVYHEKNRVLVRAGKSLYRARLLIDCMGFESPVADAYGAVSILGYYVVYGRRLKLRGHLEPTALYNLTLAKKPHYIEAFPTSEGHALVTAIISCRHFEGYHTLSSMFEFAVEHSHLSELFEQEDRPETIYNGVIPVGRLRANCYDRVYLFGEAAQCNPAASATGLTRMLLCYEELSEALSLRIKIDRLTRYDLRKIHVPPLSGFNRRLQLQVYRDMQRWSSSDFKRLVSQLSNLDNELLQQLLFGDLPDPIKLRTQFFLRLFQSGNTMLLRSMLKTLAPSV